jgi:hypothetical protein
VVLCGFFGLMGWCLFMVINECMWGVLLEGLLYVFNNVCGWFCMKHVERGLGGYGVVDAGVFFGLGGYGVVVNGVVVAWACDLGVVVAWACRSRRGG